MCQYLKYSILRFKAKKMLTYIDPCLTLSATRGDTQRLWEWLEAGWRGGPGVVYSVRRLSSAPADSPVESQTPFPRADPGFYSSSLNLSPSPSILVPRKPRHGSHLKSCWGGGENCCHLFLCLSGKYLVHEVPRDSISWDFITFCLLVKKPLFNFLFSQQSEMSRMDASLWYHLFGCLVFKLQESLIQ